MALVIHQTPIQGFHCQPTIRDLEDSSIAYNTLTDSEELKSEISRKHLLQLAEIFVKHDVQDKLGIHLMHGHSKLEEGQVMLGRRITDPDGCWLRPATLKEIDVDNIHGHIFMLTNEDRFIPYEYVQGRAKNLPSIASGFFKEFAAFIQANGLTKSTGLQIRDCEIGKAIELDFGGCGTVMLKAEDATHGAPSRTTGWVFSNMGGVITYKGSEVHSPTKIAGLHKVFIDSKLAPDVDALRGILRSYKVIP